MVTTYSVGIALQWWHDNAAPDGLTAVRRKARNVWMRQQGISGVVRGGRQYKSIPDWWEMGTTFWFADPKQEAEFVAKWCKE